MKPINASVKHNRINTAQEIFTRQRAACRRKPFLPFDQRRDALWVVEKILIDHQNDIIAAVDRDFGHRSGHETKLLEIFPTVAGLTDTRRRLKKWMKPQRRHSSLWFIGAKNRVIPQPKGIVGIISPWNYPIQLTLSPLTFALAAGNRCMIKMASHSQHLCRLLQGLIARVLPEDYVAILPGVAAEEFTPLPFDHLIYTGSPGSGRTVMQTAAQNLTPVTLELGGKSPTVIAPDFDLATAAERILFIKYMNAGQTCVAPDYLFVPADRIQAFVEHARKIVPARYPQLENEDYTAIINRQAFDRLVACLQEARNKGATVVNLLPGVLPNETQRKFPPTLVLNVTEDMQLMQEEIFGPILPIKAYSALDQVIAYINARPRPLALYVFTNEMRTQNDIIYNTLSGGVCINDCALHVAQHDLPFGGIGNSGTGQYHGYEGFLEFSKLRPVFKQSPYPTAALLYPPYGKTFEYLYRWMIKLRRF
jgi:coniferyl-aldehyde dehydrogenase